MKTIKSVVAIILASAPCAFAGLDKKDLETLIGQVVAGRDANDAARTNSAATVENITFFYDSEGVIPNKITNATVYISGSAAGDRKEVLARMEQFNNVYPVALSAVFLDHDPAVALQTIMDLSYNLAKNV